MLKALLIDAWSSSSYLDAALRTRTQYWPMSCFFYVGIEITLFRFNFLGGGTLCSIFMLALRLLLISNYRGVSFISPERSWSYMSSLSFTSPRICGYAKAVRVTSQLWAAEEVGGLLQIFLLMVICCWDILYAKPVKAQTRLLWTCALHKCRTCIGHNVSWRVLLLVCASLSNLMFFCVISNCTSDRLCVCPCFF